MGRIKSLPPRIATLPPRVRVPAKVPDPFYETAAWRDFAREIKRQRGYVCSNPACRLDCSEKPRGLIADHIAERKDGGADFDPLNVQLLCMGCHNRKTAGARERRLSTPI